MQRGKHKNLPKRLRYYQGNIDLDLISKGEDYQKLAKSYIIFICTFDLFNKGRHKYTFETMCKEDSSIKLQDETNKIILNTKGILNDLNEELIEFLEYVEHSNDEVANKSKGNLVKKTHKRVIEVKNDANVEVEFMTLLERDREKMNEAKLEDAKNFLKLGVSKEIVIEATGLSKDIVENLLREIIEERK